MSTSIDPQSTAPAPPPDAFRFGRNWQRYIDTQLDSGREQIAADSLRELVGDLAGKRFIDLGCGSGLFSLCAHRAGAREVVSIDVDPDSVAATCHLRVSAGATDNWQVVHGSALDGSLSDSFDAAEVVYSWGVLHHTGDMWRAIENAAHLVAPGGLFAIAIYNDVSQGWMSSRRWLVIKRAYNHAPLAVQKTMEGLYWLYWVLGRFKNRQNPVRVARDYRASRGMALWTDLVDWLGGYPYEFATAEEIVRFCEQRCGLRTVKVLPVNGGGTGNNQFVFERPPA